MSTRQDPTVAEMLVEQRELARVYVVGHKSIVQIEYGCRAYVRVRWAVIAHGKHNDRLHRGGRSG